ncbi:hypothetical protein GCM10009818_01470 [Nakamurella flavida]
METAYWLFTASQLTGTAIACPASGPPTVSATASAPADTIRVTLLLTSDLTPIVSTRLSVTRMCSVRRDAIPPADGPAFTGAFTILFRLSRNGNTGR